MKGEQMNEVNVIRLGVKVAAGLIGLVAFFGSFTTVSPGFRGVLVTLGKPSQEVLTEGFHLKAPFISSVKQISVRVQKSESQTEAATKDLQQLHSVIAINWSLNPETVPKLYQTIGDESDINIRVIDPAVSEVLKASTAKFTAEEVLTKRLELKSMIDELLVARLTKYNIIVQDISLVNLQFSEAFRTAIESKQVMEQESQKAHYEAQKALQEAQTMMNKARGEAESQKLVKQNLTKEVLMLEYLKKWDGKLPTFMGNSNGMLMFNINPNKGNE